MPPRRIDAEIDRLYQVPPGEFTAARNALAKQAGSDAPAVRRLAKPPVAAWAINQVYWKERGTYDALIEAAGALRQAHKAVLAGRRADLRAAGKAHEEALDAALKAALSALKESGHPATDATRQAILTTLRALPAEEPAGRLARTLQPGGFEMLAGLSIGGAQAGSRSARQKEEAAGKQAAAQSGKSGKPGGTVARVPAPRVDPKALARARETAARAARELREAEHAARREEFEAARAAREAEKTAKQVEQAREALETAREDLAAAEAAAAAAAEARDAAEARAKKADERLEEARAQAGAATHPSQNM
jgi:hypothetical protein